MNAPAGTGETIERLGFTQRQVVQEYGYDSDVDDEFRFAVEDAVGSELEDEDYTGSADAALLWWRADDGDLADGLVDVIGTLSDGGFVIVLTPRPGLPGSVDVSDLDEAAQSTGFHTAGRIAVNSGWTATRVVARRATSRH
jgi:hypothetical protein